MCFACECNIQGSDAIGCDSYGMCTCKENVTGNKCELCNNTGYFPVPDCNNGKKWLLSYMSSNLNLYNSNF